MSRTPAVDPAVDTDDWSDVATAPEPSVAPARQLDAKQVKSAVGKAAAGDRRVSFRDFPEYAEAYDNLQELKLQLEAAKSRYNLPRRDELAPDDADVLTLVKGADRLGVQPPPRADTGETITEAEERELGRKIKSLRQAIALQEDVLTRLRQDLTRQIAAEARPHYERIIKGIAEKLPELAELCRAEHAFREKLMEVPFASYLPPVVIGESIFNLDSTDPNNSHFSRFLRDAREQGYID